LYRESLHDPKIVTLSDRQHRAWHNCLLIADDNGKLPAMRDIAVHMRVTVPDAEQIICELVEAELIDVDMMKGVRVFTMHGWSARQYVSDSSTGRVKKFRQRKRDETAMKRFSNDEVTPPDTETDPESDVNHYPSSLDAERKSEVSKSEDLAVAVVVEAEARRAVCRNLGIGNADPLVAIFVDWNGSRVDENGRRVSNPSGKFIRWAKAAFDRAPDDVRAACQPLEAVAAEPLKPVKPSSSLLNSRLVKGARHGARTH
jgi:hypothetical protein